ncbi:MAG: hypothetical protein ABI978_00070 [Chloroflexota bacterium]
MIDGYSVQEAASVLGVAEGRVWELLARGVLSGTPEGDSMRVFLKALPAPMPTPTSRDEPPRTNGNGGTHANGGEASAFRELLTEFRNLTERYGQALLALGEARGEVAGLRSRVELLEARVDLRLPAALDAPSVAWDSAPGAPPMPDGPITRAAESEVSPAAPPEATPPVIQASAPVRTPVRRSTRTRKGRTTRSAVEGFAQALARAQDPNSADLGQEVAVAEEVLEPQRQADEGLTEPVAEAIDIVGEPVILEARPAEAAINIADERVTVEVDIEPLEREAVVAEPALADVDPDEPGEAEAFLAEADVEPDRTEFVIEEPEAALAEVEPAEPEPSQPSYSPTVVEPDWFADGDFAWLDAAQLEARAEPGAAPATESETTREDALASMVEAPPEAASSLPDEPAAEFAAEPDFAVQPQLPPMPEPPPVSELPPMPDLPLAADDGPLSLEPRPEPEEAEPVQPVDAIGASGEPEPDDAAPGDEPPLASREEEVMWLGVERAAASEMEMATTRWRGQPDPPVAIEEPLRRSAWPTVDLAPPITKPEPPLLAMTEEELSRLARDEGWDEAEVAAIRAMIAPPVRRSVELPVALPGAAELDDAMRALHAMPVEATGRTYPSREWAKPPRDAQSTRDDDWAFEVEAQTPPPQRPERPEPLAPRRQAVDPGWLGRRQGPAATAYRRLRRLFPG